MASLSVDTVFCVMEYLPVRDALNSLHVCKDWYSIARYEIFWKMNFQRYIVSNIVGLFQELKKEVDDKDRYHLEKILLSSENQKEKQRVLKDFRTIKANNSAQKNNPVFVGKRAVLQSLLNAYEGHVLRDKTATRDSFNKKLFNQELSQENEDTISLTGNRFKYLMEKQVLAKNQVINSSFFSSLRSNFDVDEIVVKFLSFILGEDFMRKTGNSTNNFDEEEMLFEYSIFKNILSTESGENNSKYWEIMIELSLESLPKFIPVQDLPEVLNALFDSQKYQAKIDWLSIICSNYDYYNEQCDLIVELMKRNGVDSTVRPSMENFFEVIKTYYVKKRVMYSIKYLFYLRQFRNAEEITTLIARTTYFSSFLSQLTLLEDNSLYEFLDNSSIPVDKISIDIMGIFNPNSNFLKILEYSKEKGILFPQSTVEKLLKTSNYSRMHSAIVKFITDNYHCTIYDIDSRVRFFPSFLGSLSLCVLSKVEEEFQILFSDEPIDLTRLYQVAPSVNTIGLLILPNVKNSLAFVEFCKKRFIQNVFNLETVLRIISSGQFEYYKNNSTIKKIIYENATVSENLKLTDYISTLLIDSPELFKENLLHFSCYKLEDPKFAVSLYLYLNK